MSKASKQIGTGGARSKLVKVGVRTGGPNKRVGPGYASQIGSALGNHAQEQGQKVLRPQEPMYGKGPSLQSELGNAVALNVGKGGCGTGRTLYGKSGSQGTYGTPVAGNPARHPEPGERPIHDTSQWSTRGVNTNAPAQKRGR